MPNHNVRPANIREVARRAAVSPATASRALRGSPAVTESTKDRVLAAARDLGYRLPSPAGGAGLIGVIGMAPTQWFFGEALSAIGGEAERSRHDLALYILTGQHDVAPLIERVVANKRLVGLILLPAPFEVPDLRVLGDLGIPIVAIGRPASHHPGAGIDDRTAARLATRHLVGLGHRDIGLMSFDLHDPVGRATTADRRAGFEEAMTEAGLPIVTEWILGTETPSRMSGGVHAAEQLLSLSSQPTALFAMSDELAIGALRTLRRASIDVPGRMSLIGFDNHEMAEFMDLTTVEQRVREQARMATAMLVDQLDGGAPPTEWRELPTRLVVRGTTGPVR